LPENEDEELESWIEKQLEGIHPEVDVSTTIEKGSVTIDAEVKPEFRDQFGKNEFAVVGSTEEPHALKEEFSEVLEALRKEPEAELEEAVGPEVSEEVERRMETLSVGLETKSTGTIKEAIEGLFFLTDGEIMPQVLRKVGSIAQNWKTSRRNTLYTSLLPLLDEMKEFFEPEAEEGKKELRSAIGITGKAEDIKRELMKNLEKKEEEEEEEE